jgi:hypothetical protein
MVESFERLVARYDRFKEQQEQFDRNDILERAQALLDKIKVAGGFIIDPEERNILKNLARDLGEIIYQNSDFYPSVRLKLPGEGVEINPFIYGRPVMGNEFINREAELSTIFNRLRNGESTAISGEPHIGKTSLLLKLADQTTQQAYLGGDAQSLTVSYMDMHSISSNYTSTSFWKQVLDSLGMDSYNPASKLGVEFRYSLEQIFIDLGKTKHRLVLLLDEFERLLSHPNFQDPAFFALLRSLTSRTGGLVLVTVSRFSVTEMNMMSGSSLSFGSPFFNHMINIRLRPFDEETVNRLLERFGGIFSDIDRHFIHLITGGNPFLLQAMAATLIETAGYDRHIRAAEKFYERTASHFDELWYILDDRMRAAIVVLSLMELARCILGQEFACEEIEHLEDLRNDMQRLADRGWVRQANDEDQDGGKDLALSWKDRGRVTTQAFIWWVRDVALIKSRGVPAYDEWLASEGYRHLLTQEQWTQLVNTVRDAADWNACDIKVLASRLVGELL